MGVASRNKGLCALYLLCLGSIIYFVGGGITNAMRFQASTEQPKKKNGCINADKVFCIGMFKTGTSTCGSVLNELGYKCTGRPCGFWSYYPGKMWDDAVARDYYTLERMGRHDLDQSMSTNDGPWLFMFEELHQLYGNSSRFVYTQRNLRELINSDINHFWLQRGSRSFEEVLFLQSKKMGLDIVSAVMSVLRRYQQHQQRVEEYFHDHPDLILKIDISSSFNNEETMVKERKRLEEFLGCPLTGEAMPHQNDGRAKANKTKKSYYEISDEFWTFLQSYNEFNFDGVTKGSPPIHKSTNKTAYSTWLENMSAIDMFNVSSLSPLFIGSNKTYENSNS